MTRWHELAAVGLTLVLLALGGILSVDELMQREPSRHWVLRRRNSRSPAMIHEGLVITYTARLFRPRPEILDGTWKIPRRAACKLRPAILRLAWASGPGENFQSWTPVADGRSCRVRTMSRCDVNR